MKKGKPIFIDNIYVIEYSSLWENVVIIRITRQVCVVRRGRENVFSFFFLLQWQSYIMHM